MVENSPLKKILECKEVPSYAGYGSRESPQIKGFEQWTVKSAQIENSPNVVRTLLYDAFQPLFDILVARRISASERDSALRAYNILTKNSPKLLGDIYLANFDMADFKKMVDEISEPLSNLRGVDYRRKQSNMDRDDLTMPQVFTFFRELCGQYESFGIPTPESVIGCACGASEIAFAFSGITELPVGFIRKSKRRDDDKVQIIEEQKQVLAKSLEGKTVLCFEDMVCSGRSLYEIMMEAKKLGASKVFGAAPYKNPGDDLVRSLRVIKSEPKKYGGLNIFSLTNAD